MSEADLTTFNLQYDAWCVDRLTGLTGVKPFEFFCADQFLKERCLSDAEILSGQVDAGQDGGIDGFYCFHNGVLLDDTTVIDPRSGGEIELKLFQCKQGDGFSPEAVDKITRFIDDLFSFSRPESEHRCTYHERLLTLIRLFKNQFNNLRTRSTPILSLEVFYITRLDVNEPNVDAQKAADHLVEQAGKYYSDTVVKPVQFIGVKKLWTQAKVAAPKKKSIALTSYFGTKEGWVGLVTLKNYYEFLKDANLGSDGRPKIDEHIFDSNVRGYQVKSPVNQRITSTLMAKDAPEFWQLNNGITIISPKANYSDELLEIDNPQIVNGLQTSRRIFEYCRDKHPFPETDTRRLLIRVIKTNDEDTRSEIIRATNDQNSMPTEAFISTLRIQHQIETFFESKGLFYDRRKGHYKSLNKPATQIVEIVDLMQATIAIVLRNPKDARGRPRDYLREKRRVLLFGSDDNDTGGAQPFSLEVYYRCIQIMRKIDSYLESAGTDPQSIKNLRCYIATDLVARRLRHAYYQPYQVVNIDVEGDFTDMIMKRSYDRIEAIYLKHGGNDNASKGKEMKDDLFAQLKSRFARKKKKKK